MAPSLRIPAQWRHRHGFPTQGPGRDGNLQGISVAAYDHNDPAPLASNHFWGGYFLWEGNDFLDHAIRSYLKLAGHAHRRWTGDATRGKGVNSCPSTKNTGPGK